ncbi:MAG: glycosyl hydrolase 53 family protein [Bacteroidales bacterium]
MIPNKSSGQDYAIGADLSFLKSTEDGGHVFKENKVAKPGLTIFTDHGYNWIRLRLFHSPTNLPNNLEYTIAIAKSAKELAIHGPIRANSLFQRHGTGCRTRNWSELAIRLTVRR